LPQRIFLQFAKIVNKALTCRDHSVNGWEGGAQRKTMGVMSAGGRPGAASISERRDTVRLTHEQ